MASGNIFIAYGALAILALWSDHVGLVGCVQCEMSNQFAVGPNGHHHPLPF